MSNTVILILLGLVAAWVIHEAVQGTIAERKAKELKANQQPPMHCMTCGNDFRLPVSALRGSTTLEVALWVLILWPLALVYSIWRRLGAGKAKVKCVVCASDKVVPATSPAAVAHKRVLETV